MDALQIAPEGTHLLGIILFLAVGSLGAFSPRSVQTFELKLYADFAPLPDLSLLQEYVGSTTYLWQVRIAGILCIIAAGALVHSMMG